MERKHHSRTVKSELPQTPSFPGTGAGARWVFNKQKSWWKLGHAAKPHRKRKIGQDKKKAVFRQP